jgi:hypothetical protein
MKQLYISCGLRRGVRVLNALDINITKTFLIEMVAVLHQNGEGESFVSKGFHRIQICNLSRRHVVSYFN